MTHKFIPPHLRKFIVEQNYDNYTPIDHAVWRFIMRISKSFFKKNAHKSYLLGLEKTGITIDQIPCVKEMDLRLSKFGWGAVCVRGFIPPAAFMELQSRGILAIAADMRTLNHLTYTPAPDIVHEAAGHAPIISDPDYSRYLHHYGEVSSKAISSNDDYNLYLAIRKLSDIKEAPSSSEVDIKEAEYNLEKAVKKFNYISEAAFLARMNWWTVEYGLVGSLDNPKIYGAGLLSSVGESQNCLSDKVKKIPFSLDCIYTSYDITEPQPQLFVTPNFEYLSVVLEQMASTMAFRLGGRKGLEKAKEASTVCTVELDSKIQISGIIDNFMLDKFKNPSFLQYKGPTQISRYGNELDNHGGDYHFEGYGTPVGNIKSLYKPICDFNDSDIERLKLGLDENVKIEFESGVIVKGIVKKILKSNGRILIISFIDCTVKVDDKILFQPNWGTFDMVCGSKIISVYGGPADYNKYEEFLKNEDFIQNDIVYKSKLSDMNLELNQLYSDIREMRENKIPLNPVRLENIYNILNTQHSSDWLLLLEILELVKDDFSWSKSVRTHLNKLVSKKNDLAIVIKRGLELV